MKIIETYSHFNGLEFLKIHRKKLWEEINTSIRSLDADLCKDIEVKDKNALRYSSIAFNNNFKKFLIDLSWEEGHKNSSISKKETEECEGIAPSSFNGTKFTKERVSIEIMLGKYYFESPFLFQRHLALYIVDMIDVGISILPMKSLQLQMSSGVPYYEGELYNVIRQGRGVPAVPLVIVGIMP